MSRNLSPEANVSPEANDQQDEENYCESIHGSGRFIIFTAHSWLVSLVVHFALLVALGLGTFNALEGDKFNSLAISKKDDGEEIQDSEDIPVIKPQTLENNVAAAASFMADATSDNTVEMSEPLTLADNLDQVATSFEFSEFSAARKSDLMAEADPVIGHGLSVCRVPTARSALLREYGGNESSESAVGAALEWFAEHQCTDGGWSFDHTRGSCAGRCADPGTAEQARNGATALALLPFLGAGRTHIEGQYKDLVKGGLKYLVTHIKPDHGAGGFHETGGNMYSHGLATIALCEAYAITQDKNLLTPAQAAINFIVCAQDPVGGGWGFSPHQSGDTSAAGWQIMALKSGHRGYLSVPPNTIRGAVKFLESVSADGAYYGYTDRGKRPTSTAVGLLCRMCLGWKKEDPAFERGVQHLAKAGPSTSDMYYNYYATQVMKHYGGAEWDNWNVNIRDFLVAQQDRNGHQKGSFMFSGGHGGAGGRLYNTSMATMILEVYYRHLPIHGNAAADEDFAL